MKKHTVGENWVSPYRGRRKTEFFLITETEGGNSASSTGDALATIMYSKQKEGSLQ